MRHLWNQPMISIHWTQFSSDCNFSWRLLGFFKKSQRKMKNYRHYQRSSYSWRDELFMFSDSLQTGFLVRKMRHILHPAFLSAHWKMRTRTPVCAKKSLRRTTFFLKENPDEIARPSELRQASSSEIIRVINISLPAELLSTPASGRGQPG